MPTVVWLCPILPFLNDTAENLSGILRGCAEAGVKGIVYFGAGVTLREGSREYFYAQLDRHFPGLKERYIRTYGDAYELLSPADRSCRRCSTPSVRSTGCFTGRRRFSAFCIPCGKKRR